MVITGEFARPRVIRGTRVKPLPLLPSGPGGVRSRPLHEARSLTTIYRNRVKRGSGGLRYLLKAMRLALAVVLSVPAGFAQDHVAEARAILERAREQVIHTTQRLPKYVCVETIERSYLKPPNGYKPVVACPAITGKSNPNLRVMAEDRLRIEVTVAEGGELNSWPQASKFDTRGIDEMVKGGPTSTGAFGINLMQVFQNAGAKYDLTGVKTYDGQKTFLFHYSVPLSTSNYMVKMMDGGWWKTPYSGEFDIAGEGAELKRLMIETDLLSPDSGMCRARTVNLYHHVKLGDSEFLLPLTSVLETVRPDGSGTESVTTFSGCHEYGAESVIRFDADENSDNHGEARHEGAKAEPLPSGIVIELRMESAIETDAAAAGDIVWARIVNPVKAAKSSRVLLPAGVRVRGRIVQAMHYLSEDGGFDLRMEFDRYEMNGATVPFAALLLSGKSRIPGAEVVLRGEGSAGALTIRTKAPKTVLPKGFTAKWMTAPVSRAKI